MKPVLLKQVKKGDVFKLSPTESATIWVRDDYNRTDKKYEMSQYYDVGKWTMRRGETIVYVGFDF